jgi:glutathione peroxidase
VARRGIDKREPTADLWPSIREIPMTDTVANAAKAHDFSFKTIDGEPLPLAQFKGKPVLVVNTASQCGFTPQYRELQTLWQRYRDKGLTVIGVPCNDFGKQEPGSNEEVKRFCETQYGVDFPLAAKEKVIGDDAHPFYRWAAQQAGEAGTPRWNFHKYLIGPYGELAGAYPAQVKPLDQAVTQDIERALQTSQA